ncbi:MAG: DUF2341 domain-containing protein [Chitinispirillaceae bacterium]|nr:DUF2341 domain-containing protein [Chitinispirillaceae bacterium]
MHRLGRAFLSAFAACVTTTLIFSRCSEPVSGGGTEGGNVVAGAFITENGSASAKVKVLLIPSDYNPGDADQNSPITAASTASDGSYSFDHIAQGNYSIEAKDTASGKKALVTGVDVSGEDIRVPTDTLRHPGAIRIMLPATADAAAGYVYVMGTTMYARIAGITGDAVVSAPSATPLPPLCYATPADPTPVILRYDVQVAPGDTTVVAHSGWRYARRFCLNTTAAGADVAGDVADFPILIRLTKNNFDFTQANADGGDVRFARADTVGLPYEIERWNPLAELAEVWVKVDTVRGNDGTQSLTMYWGNAEAAAPSNSGAVFDTADGFAGVWHLSENGDTIGDATAEAHDGESSGSAATPGIIGNARTFASGNFIRIPGLLGSPPNVTLSAWVRSENAEGRQDIISIGDAVLIRIDDVEEIGTSGSYHNSTIVNDSMYAIVSSGQYIVNTGWHYLVFSIDATTHTQTLYIDGVQRAISHDVNPINYAGLGPDTYIGIHGNGKTIFNFIGQIDEVRVHDTSVSADRVKLCFMNQKQADNLVEW